MRRRLLRSTMARVSVPPSPRGLVHAFTRRYTPVGSGHRGDDGCTSRAAVRPGAGGVGIVRAERVRAQPQAECGMSKEAALAAAATLLALAFALSTFERWLDRRRRHELAWTISL